MSISVYAGIRNASTQEIVWVATSSEMTSTIYADDDDCEGTANPEYNRIFDINWATRNAKMVLAALGLQLGEDEYFEISIDSLIGLTTSWLRQHLNRPVAGLEPVMDGRFIHCGQDDGYINAQVHRLSVLARAAQERGADMVYGA